METPKFIYNLIAFSQDHIDAWDKRRQREDAYSEMVEGMSREERKEFHKKFRETNPHVPDFATCLGKDYRGSFTDLNQLIEIVESQNDPYGICDCYYNHLLIEKVHNNCIDSVYWEDDGEIWYKQDENYQYKRIEKPSCFKQTGNFT